MFAIVAIVLVITATAVAGIASRGSDLASDEPLGAAQRARIPLVSPAWEAANPIRPLAAPPLGLDFYLKLVTKKPRDRGAFKVPTLRDVARRAPYMHDGSLATLRDVVVFYNKGGISNPNRTAGLKPLGLKEDEIDSLVAFLRALDGEGYQDRPPSAFPH